MTYMYHKLTGAMEFAKSKRSLQVSCDSVHRTLQIAKPLFCRQYLFFSCKSQQPKMKKTVGLFIKRKSEKKCPKSGIFRPTNN